MTSNHKKKPMAKQRTGRAGAIKKVSYKTIHLSPEQERALDEAIKNGIVHSVNEFLEISIAKLCQRKSQNEQSRREAVRRMADFGQKYHLSIEEPITRNMLHEDHRY